MDFELNEVQKIFQSEIRKFFRRELLPHVQEFEDAGIFTFSLARKLGELGYLGLNFPKQYGGSDADWLTTSIYSEELARVCEGIAASFTTSAVIAPLPILRFGTDQQKEKYIKPILKGEKAMSLAVTEPDAGSDVAGLRTTSIRKGDYYEINGSKTYITNGTSSSYTILLARQGKQESEKRTYNLFVIENDTPGFTVSKKFSKIGLHASDVAEMAFDNMKVPKESLIGEEGRGLSYVLSTLNNGRIVVGSRAVGVAQTAFDLAMEYAKIRVQFGKPISKFQAIGHKLADMALDIEASRLLIRQAAWMEDKGLRNRKECSMAKLFASQTAGKVAKMSMLIHSGIGFMDETPISRFYRDSIIFEIFEGTSEIQRDIIGRELGI